MMDHFRIVTTRVDEKCAIVSFAVLRTFARLPVVYATRFQALGIAFVYCRLV